MEDYTFKISGWSGDGKYFKLSNSQIRMEVDNDDVDESRVAAAAEYVKDLLNKHWSGEDYKVILKQHVMKRWDENKYDLQSEYESLADFLSIYGT